MPGVGGVKLNTIVSEAEHVVRPRVNPREWAKQLTEEKEIKTELLNNMTRPIQLLDKMKNFVGEVPNIIINALGTGLVAPIFIKYNPLSKADDDTKTYSAWRQPVSAVLAVLTQAGLVIPFNMLLDKATNNGTFAYHPAMYNKTSYQDLAYHEKMIKKENPTWTKEVIKAEAEKRQYTQLEDMLEQLYKKNTIEYKAKGKIKKLNTDEMKKLLEQTTDDMLKGVKDGSNEKAIIEEMKAAIKENKSVDIKNLYKISEKLPKGGNFVYDVAQKHISNMAANIKGMKAITGLGLSLAMLPFTCALLNKIYPKFMDTFFPNLSKKKNDKHQDTFTKSVDEAVQPRYKAGKESV